MTNKENKIESIQSLQGTRRDAFSVSVDCDAIENYLNFAPACAGVPNDPYTYDVMGVELLKIFDALNIKATFFCIAKSLENPAALRFFRSVLAAGHNIGNHSYSHPDMSIISSEEHIAELERGHKTIQAKLDVTPLGYRAPAYYITEEALGRLADMGYRYDSSISNATVTKLLLKGLAVYKRTFKPKRLPKINDRFTGSNPSKIRFQNGNSLFEWPIPASLGMNYYGTFHCAVPKVVFYGQSQLLRYGKSHLHYELHPIELLPADALQSFPWLSNIPFSQRTDLSAWMYSRLSFLKSRFQNTTLEEMSDEDIHFLHN